MHSVTAINDIDEKRPLIPRSRAQTARHSLSFGVCALICMSGWLSHADSPTMSARIDTIDRSVRDFEMAAVEIAECDELLARSSENVPYSRRLLAKSHVNAVIDRLTQDFPDIMNAPGLDDLTDEGARRLYDLYRSSPAGRQFWSLGTGFVHGLVDTVSANRQGGSSRDVNIFAVRKVHRSLMHEVALRLLSAPADPASFIGAMVVAHVLEDGSGELSRFAEHLFSFRLAYQRGLTAPAPNDRLVTTLYVAWREDESNVFARLAGLSGAVKETLINEQSLMDDPMLLALARYVRIYEDFDALDASITSTWRDGWSILGIDPERAKAARADRQSVVHAFLNKQRYAQNGRVTKALMRLIRPDDQLEARMLIERLRIAPELVDGPEFAELMKRPAFARAAKTTLLR